MSASPKEKFKIGKTRYTRILALLTIEQLADLDEFKRRHRFTSRADCTRWLLQFALDTKGVDKTAADRP